MVIGGYILVYNIIYYNIIYLELCDRAAKDAASVNFRRIQASMLCFGPCLVFAILFPGAFLPALEFSGIFRQILFGVVPIAMVFCARQQQAAKFFAVPPELPGSAHVPGGSKAALLPGGSCGLIAMSTITAILLLLMLRQLASKMALG
jgi:hypothetical protein